MTVRLVAFAFALASLLALSGCATQRGLSPPPDEPALAATDAAPPVDAPEAFAALAAREAALADAEREGWQLVGRMAIASGNDGGTLSVEWVQWGSAFDITLTAPVTGRTWRLHGTDNGATLRGLDGGPRRGPDAETLLLEATGWRLPVRQMPRWVRGLRGPGPLAALAVDAEGRPVGFRQGEWTLSYRDWWPGEPPLPRRVFAGADGASVRLIVSEWKAMRAFPGPVPPESP